MLFLCCFWSDDVLPELFFIKVTACFQYYIEDPYRFTCNCYLCLHPSERFFCPVPVIKEHILKCGIPGHQCTCRLIHCSSQFSSAPLTDSWLTFLFTGTFLDYFQPTSFCICFGSVKRPISPTSAIKPITVLIPTPLMASSFSTFGTSFTFSSRYSSNLFSCSALRM